MIHIAILVRMEAKGRPKWFGKNVLGNWKGIGKPWPGYPLNLECWESRSWFHAVGYLLENNSCTGVEDRPKRMFPLFPEVYSQGRVKWIRKHPHSGVLYEHYQVWRGGLRKNEVGDPWSTEIRMEWSMEKTEAGKKWEKKGKAEECQWWTSMGELVVSLLEAALVITGQCVKGGALATS